VHRHRMRETLARLCRLLTRTPAAGEKDEPPAKVIDAPGAPAEVPPPEGSS